MSSSRQTCLPSFGRWGCTHGSADVGAEQKSSAGDGAPAAQVRKRSLKTSPPQTLRTSENLPPPRPLFVQGSEVASTSSVARSGLTAESSGSCGHRAQWLKLVSLGRLFHLLEYFQRLVAGLLFPRVQTSSHCKPILLPEGLWGFLPTSLEGPGRY